MPEVSDEDMVGSGGELGYKTTTLRITVELELVSTSLWWWIHEPTQMIKFFRPAITYIHTYTVSTSKIREI